MYYAILALFIIVAILLIIITIVQKGRGDVGAAFGSGMGQTIFGAGGVETVLSKMTYWLGGIFLFLAILLSVVPKEKRESVIERELQNETVPVNQESSEKPEEGRTDNTLPPSEGKTE